ncbi:MAG: PD40 domain-containing protein [Chthoniobacterales bacterium]|nr:PD40 domain-containing protein [Chthoniobacterales bacterium]
MNTGPEVRLAILNKLEDTLDFFDLQKRRFIGAIPLPPHPHELCLSPDGKTAYASIYGDGVYGNNVHPGHEVVVVDLFTMKSVGVIDTKPYSAPHSMAIHPDGSLFVSCDKSNATLVIDPSSGQIIKAIQMPSHGGHFLTMTHDGAKVYVSNKDTAFLSVIDASTRRVSGRVEVVEGSEGIALSPDGKRLYAMSHMGSPLPNKNRPTGLSFYVIDTASDAVIQQVSLPELSDKPMEVDPESRICATPDGKYLLVSAFKWDAVVIVDVATLTPIKTLMVEAEPMYIDFVPDQPDMAYVANHGAGRVSRIDLKELRVAETFPSAAPPRMGRPEDIAFYQVEG